MRPTRVATAAQRARRKALVRQLVEEGVNQGHLEVVDAVLAPTYRGPLPDGTGPQAVKELLGRYRRAVPDAQWTIEEQIAERDTVVTRFMARGTQQGPLWGLPATGKRVQVAGVLISRFRGEAIVAQWGQVDALGLLQQLGVMPPLALDQAVVVARVLQAGARWTQ
jgi:predicted ester cyclase